MVELGLETGMVLSTHINKLYRSCELQEVSIFVFEKKTAEKLHKPKRKETITEILRSSVKQLERFRHPKILQVTPQNVFFCVGTRRKEKQQSFMRGNVVYSVEECPETLAFASEPVHGSLANLISAPAACSSGPHHIQINGPDSHPVFLDVELKYGILQIIEALQFLHYTGKILHRNVNPSSILVTKRGTWKLAGLEFIDKANEVDGLESVHVLGWTSKVPKMGQPDLDYTAPEVQITSTCSILSDMFSLGMVITSIFNNGKPLIQSNHSNSQYLKQIEVIEAMLADFLPKVPVGLHEALQRLLSKEPRQRPTSQLLALIKYFADPAVHTLQFLDVISMKDPSQKANFYRHQLKDVLPYIPKKLWFQHVWPTLQAEMRSQEVLAAVLQPILLLIQECSSAEVENIILPTFRTVFAAPKSIQATVTILENLNIVLEKISEERFLEKEVIPLLFNAFDSTTVQVQNSALISTALVVAYLDDNFIKKTVLPKTKQIYEKYSGDLKIVLNVLGCIEKILPKLDRSMIIEDVLPILYENAKTQDPDIIVKVVQIYRIMLEDNKKYGLSVNLMATRVLPSLLPQTVNPSLHLEQFTCLLEVMHHMLDHIDRNQRNKLKLDHLTAPQTSSIPNYHSQHDREYLYSRTSGLKSLHHQRSSDNMTGYGTNMFIPNVQIDNLGGSPQGSNSYVCQRKTSSAEDMIRKTASQGYMFISDGANFLRVQGQNQFPIRRLSDNTLMAPRIRVAPSSALSSPGDPLPARRHSSIGPERKNSSSSVNLSPPMVRNGVRNH
ncbi:SCY1-like protein 2 [Orchesella cincta]|uniref:SCY1-like protein 2 n=1 Tax=Orchesella cincta TaxID=48709 RepID=A0A1D2NA28_ORCCI|nr:SCY1-like protein 2 [Orchesella cincta]